MKIVVLMKQVPNTRNVRIDPKTNNLVRDGVSNIANPSDENAMEEALKLKDQFGAEVIAVSMGPMQAREVLKEALNLGADRGILLTDRAFAGADTLATGYALSVVAQSLNPDLILCGAEAIDGCTGQVGPVAAEWLGWPRITCAQSIEWRGEELIVERSVRQGIETLACALPVLVCVQKDANHLRREGVSNAEVEVKTVNDFDFDRARLGMVGSPTKVASVVVTGRNADSFVFVDGELPVRERIRMLVNGGVVPQKLELLRGESAVLASQIMEAPGIGGRI